jgi:hypothetical protein
MEHAHLSGQRWDISARQIFAHDHPKHARIIQIRFPSAEVGPFEAIGKFVLGAIHNGQRFGALRSQSTVLDPDSRGYGKSVLLQFQSRFLNQDFGKRTSGWLFIGWRPPARAAEMEAPQTPAARGKGSHSDTSPQLYGHPPLDRLQSTQHRTLPCDGNAQGHTLRLAASSS